MCLQWPTPTGWPRIHCRAGRLSRALWAFDVGPLCVRFCAWLHRIVGIGVFSAQPSGDFRVRGHGGDWSFGWAEGARRGAQ